LGSAHLARKESLLERKPGTTATHTQPLTLPVG
jgi:hypothetical protein